MSAIDYMIQYNIIKDKNELDTEMLIQDDEVNS